MTRSRCVLAALLMGFAVLPSRASVAQQSAPPPPAPQGLPPTLQRLYQESPEMRERLRKQYEAWRRSEQVMGSQFAGLVRSASADTVTVVSDRDFNIWLRKGTPYTFHLTPDTKWEIDHPLHGKTLRPGQAVTVRYRDVGDTHLALGIHIRATGIVVDAPSSPSLSSLAPSEPSIPREPSIPEGRGGLATLPQGPSVSPAPSYGALPSASAESSLVRGAPVTSGGEAFHVGDPLMQSLKLAREAELRGDVERAAFFYGNTIAYATSGSAMRPGPTLRSMPTVVVGGESLSSIARRHLFYTLQVDRQKLAAPQNAFSAMEIIKNLQTMYGRMEAIEPNDPTWPYLGAVMYAAANDYRMAAIKLAQCLKTAGGEPSVKNKARTLLAHIESAARQQQQWYEADWAAYEEYVRSGRQARDMLRGMLRFSAQDAERKGDLAKADYYRRLLEQSNKEESNK